jgi:FKBP-type peptidyl-prolyl cis-trans isomerase FkpA
MNKQIKLLFACCFVLLMITSCDPTKKWQKAEQDEIQSYVASLGDTAYVKTTDGLYYIELQAGTGRMPVQKDTVYFRYTGMFLNRVVFDSNVALAEPYGAIIGDHGLIAGIEEGITLMKEGGKARFLTPSSLAYGGAGSYGIGGYTPLLWELTLVTVKPGSKK